MYICTYVCIPAQYTHGTCICRGYVGYVDNHTGTLGLMDLEGRVVGIWGGSHALGQIPAGPHKVPLAGIDVVEYNGTVSNR